MSDLFDIQKLSVKFDNCKNYDVNKIFLNQIKMSAEGKTKSKIGKGQLSTLLHNIEREQKNEMRMHNTIKQQFKTKYSRFDFYVDAGKSSNVRLYETHNPGFCFRRNGEAKPVQSSMMSPSVTYQDIHDMLFSDGELDLDKVLCLHLLTAHKTETLTPPVRNHRALSFLAKEQSPLERLIERSRKRRKSDHLMKLLPTYVLDVTEENEEECLIRDGRLAERIIINDKIVQLVHTVLEALQTSNPEKMNNLISTAKDEDALKTLVDKPHLQDFLKTLRKQMVIRSCDSFHLTQPFKSTPVALKLKASSHSLRNLVNHIRKNVLQYPSQSTWRDMYDKSHYREEDGEDDLINERFSGKSQRRVGQDNESKEKVIKVHGPSNLSNHDATELKSGSKNLKRSYSNDNETKNESPRLKSNNKTMDAGKRDPKSLNVTYKNENASLDDVSINENEGVKKLARKKSSRKSHVLTLDDLNDNNIKSISLTELSRIINFQIKKLTSDDKRNSKYEKQKVKSPSLRDYKNFAKGVGSMKGSIDTVGLDMLDLAKITQKIREQETEKKLSRFLQNS